MGSRRTTAEATLGGAELCEAAGIDPQARAETIEVEGFLKLAERLLERTA